MRKALQQKRKFLKVIIHSKALAKLFNINGGVTRVKVEMITPNGVLEIHNPQNKHIPLLKGLNAPRPAPSGLRKITSEDIFKSAGLDGFLGFTSISFSIGSKKTCFYRGYANSTTKLVCCRNKLKKINLKNSDASETSCRK